MQHGRKASERKMGARGYPLIHGSCPKGRAHLSRRRAAELLNKRGDGHILVWRIPHPVLLRTNHPRELVLSASACP